MNIGNSIKMLRKQKRLSQGELAEAADLSQPAMSAIENGTTPNTDTLDRICKALGVTPALVYAMAMEKGDIPDENRVLYDSLFPIIQKLVLQIASPQQS